MGWKRAGSQLQLGSRVHVATRYVNTLVRAGCVLNLPCVCAESPLLVGQSVALCQTDPHMIELDGQLTRKLQRREERGYAVGQSSSQRALQMHARTPHP